MPSMTFLFIMVQKANAKVLSNRQTHAQTDSQAQRQYKTLDAREFHSGGIEKGVQLRERVVMNLLTYICSKICNVV